MSAPSTILATLRAMVTLWSFLLGFFFVVGAQAAQQSGHVVGLHLAHPTMSANQAMSSKLPDGYVIVPSPDGYDGLLLVASAPFLTNADFSEISAGFDEATNAPIINFRLTSAAAKILAEVTRDNIGTAIAIIADGAVISAPIIVTEIAGGRGIISGSFGTEGVKDLVARMRAAKSD